MTTDNLKNRIEKLEEICAHQLADIESLSQTVQEQWEHIDALKKAIIRFRDRLTEVEEGGTAHENTPPPHY